ncbi:MAG: AAA family ATPase [Desulfovibrio sp.]|nr:AAA family ATPase [Desulfovibrio sp.]
MLTGECFVHLADEYAHLVSLLRAAVKRRERGVNILLYGPPGTGKTELAKTLCAEIQADLYSLSENLQNDYCEGGGRLSELYAAQAVLRTEDQTVLLADEAEDIFRGKYSKLSMNRLLEKNVTPVIWISNNIEFMDPAYIRRFSYAVFINTPPLSARVRIWKNELHKKNISIPAAEVEHLARRYDLPPSFTSEAIRIAGMLRDKSSIDRTLQSLECALGGKPKAPCGERPDVFHPALLNTDTDLEKLAERVERGNNLSFSLCLFGAPGTGKSAYARYLAGRMGFETLHKRASDLQSMWLGETEKNIARAFLEAREGKKLLIFDEVDSFLQDRGRAVRSWEVSQVNEMLAWMENHPYPFVCTTNLLESLDKASLRRFTFKVKYEYLTPNQASLAFRHFFGLEYSLDMRALTPGDFAVVKKKAAILGMREPAELAGLLAQEQEARGVVKSAKIGF